MEIGENSSFSSIPVIDIGPLFLYSPNDIEFQPVVDAISDACKRVGFFYIKNHGIPKSEMDLIFQETAAFFDLPLDIKQKVSIGNSKHHRGYVGIGEEGVDEFNEDTDLKQAFDIGLDLAEDDPEILNKVPNYGPNQWPEGLPSSWKINVLDYYNRILQLGRRLTVAFAVALKLDINYFQEMYKKPMSILRLLKYPPQSEKKSKTQLGCGVHTDYGFLTILAQDSIGGLQVQNVEGKWIDATPIEGTLVVNLGDMMARATNDIFKATPHRVINPPSTNHRYSLPFFFDPHYNTYVECFDSCKSSANLSKYSPVIFGEHLLARLDATYSYRKKES